MNISVRVTTQQAAKQLAAVQSQVLALQKTVNRASGSSMISEGGFKNLERWGSQMQWMGRQLIYNFTLPIIAAGGYATKFALDNEKAMVRVTKVYGDAQHQASQYRAEITALGKSFVALSDMYGVAQSDVINIAADWAQAGASGLALAKSTQLTIQTMILGEMNASDATQALIAIQAQYGLSTKGLTKTIAILNMVENQTGVNMEGLIQGFTRAASVARASGVDVRHLAAFIAALSPAAGSAANAGNALKTILSRLFSQTSASADIMQKMGINIYSASWQMLNGTQRIELMAKSFEKLSNAQQAVVSSTVASRYQINRFDVLMQDVSSKTGYYAKSLQSTNSNLAVFRQYQQELNQVLKSNPQQLQRVWVVLKNAMAQVIVPMIPLIIYLANGLATLVTKFSNLNPGVQKLVLLALGLLAIVGPLVRYFGAFAVLIGNVGSAFKVLSSWLGITTAEQTIQARDAVAGARSQLANQLLIVDAYKATGDAAKIAGAEAVLAGLESDVAAAEASAGWWAMQGGLLGVIKLMLTFPFVLLIGGFGKLFELVSFGFETIMSVGAVAFAGLAGIFTRYFMPAVETAMAGSEIAVYTLFERTLTYSELFLARIKLVFYALGEGFLTIAEAVPLLFRSVFEFIEAGFAAMATDFLAFFKALPELIFSGIRQIPLIIAGVFEGLPELIAAVFLSPWVLAIAAVVAVVLLFRKQIVQIIQDVISWWQNGADGIYKLWAPVGDFFDSLGTGIAKVFDSLPASIQSAMVAAYNIVKSIALQIYDVLSYIDPFAHHSPSLVEQTQKGMKTVSDHHKKAGASISNTYAGVNNDLQTFKKQTGSVTGPTAQYSKDRADIKKVDPKALASFDKLIADLTKLQPILNGEQQKINALQPSVDKWSIAVDKVNAKLQIQQDKLTILQATQAKWQAQMDTATSRLQVWSTAPLKGTQAFTDAIFKNTMAQNKLQLQIDKWQDANGSLDTLNNRLDSINGALEVARGTLQKLQAGGAGSEITSVYMNQVSQLEAQQKSLAATVANSPIAQLQAQLAKLQNQGDELNLEQSLKLDPLNHKIQELANTTKEVSFKQAAAETQKWAQKVEQLKPQLTQANQAVNTQQRVIDKLTLAKDKLSLSYDRENGKLQILNDQYQRTNDLINNITSAFSGLSSASSSVSSSAAGGAGGSALDKQFAAGKNGNFANVGGTAKIGRKGSWADQSKLIDQFTKGIQQKTADMFGKFSIIGPLKSKWHDATNWLSKNVKPTLSPIKTALENLFTGGGTDSIRPKGMSLDNFIKITGKPTGLAKEIHAQISSAIDAAKTEFGKLASDAAPAIKTVENIFGTAFRWISNTIKLFLPDIKHILSGLVVGFEELWKKAGPQVEKFTQLIRPLSHLFENLWSIVKPILQGIGIVLLFVAKILMSVLGHTLPALFKGAAKAIGAALQVIRGTIGFVIDFINTVIDVVKLFFDILTGQWGKAWSVLKTLVTQDLGGLARDIANIFTGIWKTVAAIFETAFHVLTGIVKGIVEGIFGFFKWLWDVLVGHSIIPDLINAIVTAWQYLIFLPKWIWKNVLKPVYDFFKSLYEKYMKPIVKDTIKFITDEWQGLKDIGQWIWNHVLHPIIHFFEWAWNGPDGIKSHLQDTVSGVTNIWHGLASIGTWIWNHVLQPIVGLFENLWSKHLKGPLGKMAGFFETMFSRIGGYIADGINIGIDAVDALISGLNWVGNHVPGLKFHIPEIQKVNVPGHATGAMMASQVGSGFKTGGPRAIVGEGSPTHPEYVIPTDPRYRNNATRLLSSLMADMARRGSFSGSGPMAAPPGATYGGVPAYGIGGWLNPVHDAQKAWDAAKGAGKYVKKAAVIAAFAPFLKAFDTAAKGIPNGMHQKDWLEAEKNNFYNWAKGDAEKAVAAAKIPNSNYMPAGGSSVSGTARVNKILGELMAQKYGWGSGTQWNALDTVWGTMESGWSATAGNPSSGAYGIPQADPPRNGYGVTRAQYMNSAAAQIKWGLGYIKSSYGNPANALRQELTNFRHFPPQRAGDLPPHGYFSGGVIPNLRDGAIIKRKLGGTLVNVGEGNTDEAVVPLPPGYKPGSGGGTTNNFYGNLNFPNVKSGEDAEEFIRNLKALS